MLVPWQRHRSVPDDHVVAGIGTQQAGAQVVTDNLDARIPVQWRGLPEKVVVDRRNRRRRLHDADGRRPHDASGPQLVPTRQSQEAQVRVSFWCEPHSQRAPGDVERRGCVRRATAIEQRHESQFARCQWQVLLILGQRGIPP